MLDGYFHLVFLIVFSAIAYLWRPTSNNQRYGLSQLPQSEEEAEEAYGMNTVKGNMDVDPEDDLEAGEDVMRWVEENVLAGPEEEEAAIQRALADEEEVKDLIRNR